MGVKTQRSAARNSIQSRAASLLDNIRLYQETSRNIARLFGNNIDPDFRDELISLKFNERRWSDRLNSIENELGINNDYPLSISMESIGNNTSIEAQMNANAEYISKLEKDIETATSRLKKVNWWNRKSSVDHPLIEAAKKELNKAKIFSKQFKLREDESRILSKEEIMSLNHADRARMLNENNESNYSDEQLQVIHNLKDSLGESNVQKILDAAILSKNIEGSRKAFNYNTKHPEMLQSYIENIKKRAIQQLKISHDNRVYTNLKYALHDYDNVQSKVDYIHQNQVSSGLVSKYLEEYPEYEEEMRPLVPLLDTKENLLSLVMSKQDLPIEDKKSLISVIYNFSTSPSREAMLKGIEEWMYNNAEYLPKEVSLLNNIIKESKELEQLINSTTIESVEQRLHIAEENKRKKEEEEKAEKERKEEIKRVEEENNKQRESLPVSTEEYEEAFKFLDGVAKNNLEDYNKFYGSNAKYNKDDATSINTAKSIVDKYQKQTPKEEELNADAIENIDISDDSTEKPVEDKKADTNSSTTENEHVPVKIEDIDISDGVSLEEQFDTLLTDVDNNLVVDIDTKTIPEAEAEHIEDITNPNIILGNSKFRYDSESVKEGKKIPRKGEDENDTLSKFFRWMDSAGFTYQETIDLYLSNILTTDPDIQFMMVNPVDNSTNDKDMADYILTVVEYNDSIKKIYRNPGNNVVEVDGKKYLVIGNTGFTKASQPKYSELINYLKRDRTLYFNKEGNEGKRFYVEPKLKTKIKSIGRGYYIHQQENDSTEEFRSITALLENPSRNPRNHSLRDLKWGIVLDGEFVSVNGSNIDIVTPIDLVKDNGRVYLLIKASNGKYLPVLVLRKSFNEINEGTLKNLILSRLEDLTSKNIKVQARAIKELRNIIYFPKGTAIKLTPEGKIQVKIGTITNEYDPRVPDFNKDNFINKIININPFINITISTLMDEESLLMYDSAGALSVNIAQLYTSNADYSLYAVNTTTGSIIADNYVEESNPVTYGNLENTILPEIVYRTNRYVKTDAGYTLNGELITDATLIQELEWMSIILNSNPSYVEGNTQYYVLDNNSTNPVVIKYNTLNKVPKKTKVSWAKQIIQKIDNIKKAENAKNELSSTEEYSPTKENLIEDTSQSGIELLDIINGKTEDNTKESNNTIPYTEPMSTEIESLTYSSDKSLSIESILLSEEYGDDFQEILESKNWEDMPDNINQLENYLTSKGIDVLNITNVETFLNMIKECK